MSFFWGMIGLFIGSFLGVTIDRLPYGKSIAWGRSRCDYCNKPLRWFELIPVFSFFIQRGRCRRCHKKLSWRYPVIEIATGLLFAFVWFYTGPSIFAYLSALVVVCSLFVIVMIDLDHMIIPDIFVLTASIGAAMYHLLENYSLFAFLKNNFLTAIASYILFRILWEVTRRKGVGFGDVKLSFALGLLVGFPQIIISLYAAFLTGAFVAVILLLCRKKTMKSAVPFGPFLVLGAVISLFFDAHQIISYFI